MNGSSVEESDGALPGGTLPRGPRRRGWLTALLFLVALGCLLAALYPTRTERKDAESGDRILETRFGLPFSPLVETVKRYRERGGYSWRSDFNWTSWSTLSAVISAFAFEAFRKRLLTCSGRR